MAINELDQKVLDQLGLSNIPDEEKQAVLAMIDQRLEKRFLANLLMSLPEDKRQELDQKVEQMEGEPEPGKVIELVLNLHPDAKGILEKSAQEIVEELKQEKTVGTPAGSQTEIPETPPASPGATSPTPPPQSQSGQAGTSQEQSSNEYYQ